MAKPLDQVLDALEHGHVTFPYILFTHYRSIGLTDQDAMVILQISSYQQMEGSFPSLDELVGRMSISKDEVAAVIQRLLSQGLIYYKNQLVSIRPLIERIFGLHDREKTAASIFARFEEEFGRLLSPLEYEQVMRWLDDDDYPEWLIVEALRESVLSGVFNFRYVDTILRDWERAHISTSAQLAEYRDKYRKKMDDRSSRRQGSSESPASRASKSHEATGTQSKSTPAAQPGKYNRFYELYKGRSEIGPMNDEKAQS